MVVFNAGRAYIPVLRAMTVNPIRIFHNDRLTISQEDAVAAENELVFL